MTSIEEKIKKMDNMRFELAVRAQEDLDSWRDSKSCCTGTSVYEQLGREASSEFRYNQLIASRKSLNALSRKRDEYVQLVMKYSKFDTLFIVDALATLISAYKGEDYVVRHANYHQNELDENNEPIVTNPLIIVAKENDAEFYYHDVNDMDELVNSGKAIILRNNEDSWMGSSISFYREVEHIDLSAISYAQEFVDSVIEYRIEYKLEEISDEILYRLLSNFIESHLEEIRKSRKLSEKENEVKQEIAKHLLLLQKKAAQ